MLLTSQYPLVESKCFQKTSHLAKTYLQHYKLRSWVLSSRPWETHALAFQDYAWTWLSVPYFLLHWDLKVVEHCKLPSQDFCIQAQSSKGTLSSTQNYDDSSITMGDIWKVSPLDLAQLPNSQDAILWVKNHVQDHSKTTMRMMSQSC